MLIALLVLALALNITATAINIDNAVNEKGSWWGRLLCAALAVISALVATLLLRDFLEMI